VYTNGTPQVNYIMRLVFVLALLAFVACSLTHGAEVEMETEMDMEMEVQLPGYREQIAQQLRFYSQSTYCSVDSVTSWTCPTCKQGSLANFKLTHKFFDANTNTFGYAGLAPAAGENIIVFSFRGATPSAGRNWITDLNAQRMPYPGLRGATVHKGFYNAYLSIARQVNLAAKSLLANCQGCHIYVTGHSLGGAIATLAAADLFSLTPDLTVYTFGSPRVGDLAFASYFDKIVPDTFRIVNEKDLVPHIPQRFLGFRHVSREIWYHGAGGRFKQCNGGEDDACSNSINLHVDEHSIKDHAVYLDQPMGCRPADLSRMGLINLLEEEVEIKRSVNPLEKLKAKYTDQDVLLEVESSKSSSDAELDALEAAADFKAQRLKLSGGKEVFPARVLDPLSKPGIRALENVFHTVQTNWNKLPVSWNPHIQEETAEERWNRKYPEPK
jgi:hypothetical protein